MAWSRPVVDKVIWLVALFLVTVEIVAVGLAVYKELLATHYLLFLLASLYVPALTTISLSLSPSARIFAAVWSIASAGAIITSILIIAVQWSTKGQAYLGLDGVSGGWAALVALIASLALVVVCEGLLAYLTLVVPPYKVKV